MAAPFTVHRFFEMFPDDDMCLDYLMEVRFGEHLECPSAQARSEDSARLRGPDAASRKDFDCWFERRQ